MRPRTFFPRPLLLFLAVFFCAATLVYAFLWMFDARRPGHTVEIGFNQSRNTDYDPLTSCIPVYNVIPDSPAERAGLRAGDHIIAVNGRPLNSSAPYDEVWSRSSPGDPVQITVERPGEPEPLTLQAIFRAASQNQTDTPARASTRQVTGLFPVLFFLVGFAVLFLRLDDPYAWLLAVLFACFVGAPGFHNLGSFSPTLHTFLLLYRAVFNGMLPALFYIFFALFPERSPLDHRVPWLKWFAVVFCVSQVLPSLSDGDPHWPAFAFRLLGITGATNLRHAVSYSLFVLGFLSLLRNSFGKESSGETRRKSRVILWGTILGVFPAVIHSFIGDFTGYQLPFWLSTFLILALILYPLSFAYAVVKHRVLEIPALLRRSARYVLVQRSFSILLFLGAFLAIFLFSRFFSSVFAANSQFGMALSAVFGVTLVWASGPFVKRGTQTIDRAFFRSSYDARLILQDLAEKIRDVKDRQELAALLDQHLTQALHPKSQACYFLVDETSLVATGRDVSPCASSLELDSPFLRELSAHGRSWDVPPPDSPIAFSNFPLAPLAPECLVPLLGHDAHLVGVLALGQPLSEEPYSSEDKRLLDSVASHAAVALENIHMAEHMADRLEMDGRAGHEMQIARDVQSRLFPQIKPPLASLDYAGSCVQARQVGGDYFDFLAIDSRHLAFVLADISGKGIAGALLMANLQANLRSRYATALNDLSGLLQSVNTSFHENSPDDRYATLFLALYDDIARTLEYANCGHNFPLLFRADGSLERLASTSTVIGLFSRWDCATQKIQLFPDDLLVIYTDGVTEAEDVSSNEFGEVRLVETVRANCRQTPAILVQRIQEAVQKFSAGDQSDDLTLVIALDR